MILKNKIFKLNTIASRLVYVRQGFKKNGIFHVRGGWGLFLHVKSDSIRDQTQDKPCLFAIIISNIIVWNCLWMTKAVIPSHTCHTMIVAWTLQFQICRKMIVACMVLDKCHLDKRHLLLVVWVSHCQTNAAANVASVGWKWSQR